MCKSMGDLELDDLYSYDVVLSICDSFFDVCEVDYTDNFCVPDFDWTTSV